MDEFRHIPREQEDNASLEETILAEGIQSPEKPILKPILIGLGNLGEKGYNNVLLPAMNIVARTPTYILEKGGEALTALGKGFHTGAKKGKAYLSQIMDNHPTLQRIAKNMLFYGTAAAIAFGGYQATKRNTWQTISDKLVPNQQYRVKKGDTAYSLERTYGLEKGTLPKALKVGQKIIIKQDLETLYHQIKQYFQERIQ